MAAASCSATTRPPSRAMRDAVAPTDARRRPGDGDRPPRETVRHDRLERAGLILGGGLGHLPVVGGADEIVDDRLRQLSLAHRDEWLQRQPSGRRQRRRVLPGLLQEVAQQRPALGLMWLGARVSPLTCRLTS